MTDTRPEYWDTVKMLAESVLDDYDDGYNESDAIHEQADGCYWVIWTHAAKKALDFTRNPDAWRDCYGSLSDMAEGKDDPDELWPLMAYFALCRDVAEALEELKIERAEA